MFDLPWDIPFWYIEELVTLNYSPFWSFLSDIGSINFVIYPIFMVGVFYCVFKLLGGVIRVWLD